MRPKHQSLWFRTEYGIATAILLTACGQFLIVIFSIFAWYLIRAFRPAAPALLVIAASIFVAVIARTLVTGRIPVLAFIEIIGAATVAFVLLFRGTNFWACLLIVHSVLVVVVAILNLPNPNWTTMPPNVFVGAIILNVFVTLLLIEYLRTKDRLGSTAQAMPNLTDADEH